MLSTIARNRITIYRTSNNIVENITPTTLQDTPTVVNVSATPINTNRYKSIISITATPSPSSGGKVTITGVVNGSTTSEEVTIPTSGVAQSTKIFTSVATLVISGSVLNNKEMTFRFIGSDGGSIKARRTLISCQPAVISRGKGSWKAMREGTIQMQNCSIMIPCYCTGIYTPREGDIIQDEDTGVRFIIVGAPLIEQAGISKFYQVNAQRYQQG